MKKISVLILCATVLIAAGNDVKGPTVVGADKNTPKEIKSEPVVVADENTPSKEIKSGPVVVADKNTPSKEVKPEPVVDSGKKPSEDVPPKIDESAKDEDADKITVTSETTTVTTEAADSNDKETAPSSPVTNATTSSPSTVSSTISTAPTAPNTEPTKPNTIPSTTITTTTERITTSSTTVSPSTTPVPPPAKPTEGTWVVNGTNTTCIIVKMAVQFDLTYTDSNNKTAHALINLPSENSTVATGECGKDNEQNLTISWNNGSSSFQVHFVEEENKKRYNIHHLDIHLQPSYFNGSNLNTTVNLIHNATEFSTGLGNSYKCLKSQKLSLTDPKNQTSGHLQVTNLQFQAFKNDKSQKFGLAEDCAFDTPDVVPIAVGCALAALVIIVLIAYLWSRRRREARGYLNIEDNNTSDEGNVVVSKNKNNDNVAKKSFLDDDDDADDDSPMILSRDNSWCDDLDDDDDDDRSYEEIQFADVREDEIRPETSKISKTTIVTKLEKDTALVNRAQQIATGTTPVMVDVKMRKILYNLKD